MRPDPKRTQLEHEYTTALRDAIGGAGEMALAHAYELGRVAAASGVGVVDLVSIHDTAVREVLGATAPPAEVGQFVTEALSPFEMTHRGFREAHEQLEAAYRELESFSYSVSHDLRAPLRTISAFTQALADDLKFQLDDKARDHLRRVLAAAARMSDLIDALLELSHISRASLGRHKIDLTAMATGIVEDLRRRDVTRKLSAEITPEMSVEADGRLLRIMLENLIGNAWKFTTNVAHPKVTIGVEHREDERVFFVTDNGAGFDMAFADRLFTPFQRLHSAREFAGTGIGLATVRRIIERHGGRIWAESELGKGATFFFTLPA
jgi:light-regulated signal transduction histidine kinase (bacteriophytochrome)